MDGKAKKRLEVIRQKMLLLKQRLAGAKKQDELEFDQRLIGSETEPEHLVSEPRPEIQHRPVFDAFRKGVAEEFSPGAAIRRRGKVHRGIDK